MSIQSLKQLNAASGLVFGVFLVLHLLNHYSLSFGWETALSLQQTLRVVYQNPLFEVLIFASLLAHMYSNAMIYSARSKLSANAKDKKEGSTPSISAELKAHRYAGYFLAVSIFGHVIATRLGPIIILGDQAKEYDYSFAAGAKDHLPGDLFFYYVALLGIAGGWHLIYGTRAAIATLNGRSVAGTKFPMPLKVLALANHILIVSACFALAGVYYAVDTTTKQDLHNKLYTAMGM